MNVLNILIDVKPFNKRKGRIPSSKEYEIGTKIWLNLKVGESTFISQEFSGVSINPDAISIRLLRLEELEKEGRRYSVQSEKRIKEGLEEGLEESGYRVYRLS